MVRWVRNAGERGSALRAVTRMRPQQKRRRWRREEERAIEPQQWENRLECQRERWDPASLSTCWAPDRHAYFAGSKSEYKNDSASSLHTHSIPNAAISRIFLASASHHSCYSPRFNGSMKPACTLSDHQRENLVNDGWGKGWMRTGSELEAKLLSQAGRKSFFICVTTPCQSQE